MGRKGKKRPAANAPASETKVAKRAASAAGSTSTGDDDSTKDKATKRLVLHYDEVMAAGDDSATALFELANATHVVFRVGGRELTIQQDPGVVGTGGCVWETAYLMAQWLQPRLAELQREDRPLRCLEVGAGCGLLGVALAHAGCDVLLTEQESAMANLSANVAANAPPKASGGVCAAAPLSWLDDCELEAVAARGPWQVLIGTDVVYKAELVRPLLRTLWRCASGETKCWLCLQERDADAHAMLLRLAPCFFRRVAPVPLEGLSFSEELECFLLSLEGRRDAVLDEEQARLEERNES